MTTFRAGNEEIPSDECVDIPLGKWMSFRTINEEIPRGKWKLLRAVNGDIPRGKRVLFRDG